MLSQPELLRYNRQLLMREIGRGGQEILKKSAVLIVGLGGLGSPVALYLAAAGVGRLGLVDMDRVDEGNIHRQIIHASDDVGKYKVVSAQASIHAVNPLVETTVSTEKLVPENADDVLAPYDLAAGCLDNFAARYDLDAACRRQGKVHVYGSVRGWEGQASVFAPGGPCYRCFFRDPPPRDWKPNDDDKAIVGTTPGIIGSIMAQEVIKSLLGLDGTLQGRLLLYDGLRTRFRELAIHGNPACPVCGVQAWQPTE
ncbi:MAG: HesA/MoeB/ThiF family protein [Planctomycetaceae bacterium]|nr:HesA/MoeB/ThiF family protein [Planctomycetaceae bacterium]